MKYKILSVAVIGVCVLVSAYFILQHQRIKSLSSVDKPTAVKNIYTDSHKNDINKHPGTVGHNKQSRSADRTLQKKTQISILIEQLDNRDITLSQKAADKLTSYSKQAVPELIAALSSATIAKKGQIIFILGRIKDTRAVPVLLNIADKDENAYIRSNAVEALGKIRDERALHGLCKALFDDDSVVRQRSAWAIGEIKSPKASSDLISRLGDEKEETVRSAVVKSLGSLQDKSTTPVLVSELTSRSDHLYKNDVITALGEIADTRALPELIAYRDNLKKNEPKEKIVLFQWQESLRITEEAIKNIKEKNL